MSLARQLREYIAACFIGIWGESHEHADALAEMNQLCRENGWQLAAWDVETGLNVPGQLGPPPSAGSQDPLAAIRALSAMAIPDGTAILVLHNFHRFLQSAEIVQALVRQIVSGKQQRTFVVVLGPVVQIPIELEKLFVIVQHELPGRHQLAEIARGIACEEGELPTPVELDRLLDAAGGLTRYEAEGAYNSGFRPIRTGPAPRSGLVAVWRRYWMCHWSRPPRTSCRWLPRPPKPCRVCETGPRAAAWPPIGPESFHPRRLPPVVVA